MKPQAALYLGGRLADVGLTAWVLSHGGIELNPIWAGVYAKGWTVALGLQLIAAAPIFWVARRLPFAWIAWTLLGLASWFPVAWNIHQLG